MRLLAVVIPTLLTDPAKTGDRPVDGDRLYSTGGVLTSKQIAAKGIMMAVTDRQTLKCLQQSLMICPDFVAALEAVSGKPAPTRMLPSQAEVLLSNTGLREGGGPLTSAPPRHPGLRLWQRMPGQISAVELPQVPRDQAVLGHRPLRVCLRDIFQPQPELITGILHDRVTARRSQRSGQVRKQSRLID
jgi:hypothetical protein